MVAGRQAHRPKKKSDELSGVIQCLLDGLAAKLLALLPGTWIGPQVEYRAFHPVAYGQIGARAEGTHRYDPRRERKASRSEKGPYRRHCQRIFHRLGLRQGVSRARSGIGGDLPQRQGQEIRGAARPRSRGTDRNAARRARARPDGRGVRSISKDWGKLDFLVHSIAFSPKEALQGRVVDVPAATTSSTSSPRLGAATEEAGTAPAPPV